MSGTSAEGAPTEARTGDAGPAGASAAGVEVPPAAETVARARAALAGRPLVLVGLMGVGKTTIGRMVAQYLDLPFFDADEAIEEASRMTIPDIFERFGEEEFRRLERRVVARLLDDGPMVLATGGGAFVNGETRAAIRDGARTVWLRAELDVLVERTARRKNKRPLLRDGDPRAILKRLMEERHPIYAEADLVVESERQRREAVASKLVHALAGAASTGPAP